MASNATNRFPGDGVTTTYEINFVGLYLDRSHVFAYREDDTTKDRTAVPIDPAQWLNATTIQGFAPVPVGSTLVIYRNTPAAPLVDFVGGAWLTPTALDTATRQGLFKAVEAGDADSGGGGGGGGLVAWSDVQGKPYASATVPGLIKVGSNLSIAPDGTLNAAGGGGGGGVTDHGALSGLGDDDHTQYFNAARGDSRYAQKAHTHGLSDIAPPGGAVNGQVVTVSGGNFVLGAGGGGSSSLPTIVYIGDSLGSDHPNLAVSPAVQLERVLNANGYACQVVNLSVNAHSFYRANTSAVFGSQTVVQRAIALAPAAVIVALGFNDTVMEVDARSLANVQADATTFFSTLRAALPSTPIVAATELAYDKTNFTPATLKNRGVLPIMMTLRSSGILTGCWSSEILEDTLAGATQTKYANFATLDTTIRSLGSVSAVITIDLWKIARLGLCSGDGLHLTAFGSSLVATTWRKAFTSVPALAALAPNLRALTYAPFDGFMNVDGTVETGGMWDLLMQPSGSDWAIKAYSQVGQHTNRQGGPWTHCNPAAWFLPSHGAYKPSTLDYVMGTTFSWVLRNVAPSTDVQASVDGAAFVTIGQTTHYGDYLGSGILPISTAGTYVFRYKVGNEVHGPVSLVVTAGASSSSWQPKVISGTNLAAPPQSISTPNSRTYIDFNSWNFVTSHPDLSLTKAGMESRIKVTVAAGKAVWVRLAMTQLVTASTGANTLWMLGAEVMNSSLGTLYNLQLDAKYSPTTDYALVLSGSFVGRLTATTIFVPWVLTSGTGAISSSATNGISTFWSLEIINEA